MSSYIEIGQILDIAPASIKVIEPKIEIPKVVPKPDKSLKKSESNYAWASVLLIGLTIGVYIIYLKSKQDENIITSNQS